MLDVEFEQAARVAYATDGTTHHYAALYRQLRQRGTPVPVLYRAGR